MKRALSFILALAMLLSLLPATALASTVPWNGKTAVFVGDSITAGVGTEKIYHQYLKESLGLGSVTAMGVAGSCISAASDYGQSNQPLISRYQNIPSADLIVIFMSTNDYGHETPLGSETDTQDGSFYGALNTIIPALTARHPSSRIVFVTPMHRYGFGTSRILGTPFTSDSIPNGVGAALCDYVSALKTVCAKNDVSVIDLYTEFPLDPADASVRAAYMPDGLHPNAAGHELIAGIMASHIRDLAPADDAQDTELIYGNKFAAGFTQQNRASSRGNMYLKAGTVITLREPAVFQWTCTRTSGEDSTDNQGYFPDSAWSDKDTAVAEADGWVGFVFKFRDETRTFDLSKPLSDYIVIEEPQEESDLNYRGKVISVLGDSISTFAGYIPTADGFNLEHLARYPQDNLLTDVNETWWMQVIAELDAKLGINDSWRGATVSGAAPVTTGTTGENAAMGNLQRIRNLGANGTPDVILFYGGTNDLAHVSKVGSFDPDNAPDTVDLVTKKWDNLADGYVNTLLRLRHFYPDTRIIALLPTYTSSYYSNAKLSEGNAVLASICEYYGVTYVDLRDCGISTADLPDGIHPDAAGMDFITEAVLEALMAEDALAPGENVVHSVTHQLTGASSSLGYYKGVSHGKPFSAAITGEDLTVSVTMGGADVTDTVYSDGIITIPSVTGDLVIRAEGHIKPIYEDHLQQLPADHYGKNLWQLLDYDTEYFSGTDWIVHSSGKVRSVTFPVTPGEKIYADSFTAAGSNGGSINGIRVTWFNAEGVLKSVGADAVYAEYAENGCLTVPEGAAAVNIPMWSNASDWELYVWENSCDLALRYDDHMDMTGKAVEIIDAGVPTSYQVGCGVEENKVPDTAVVTMKDNTLVATGIGTAKVRIDGLLYTVTVSPAPISLLLIIGQSNAEGMEGNANQSIICDDGQVYSTYAESNGLVGDAGLTVENAGNYVPSALTGTSSTVNVNGTTTKLSGYPVNSLTAPGAGKYGMDSGLAYEWVRQTGEKVWVVNAAHGASGITSWQKNAENYEQAVALFRACQQVLQAEIAAGHYTFSHMGYYWNQGCADETRSAEWYVSRYLAMHDHLKIDLACDMDSNSATADNTLEFGNIVLVQAGHDNASGYRKGAYEDTSDSFFMTYKELELRGPRVAQIWMANNPDLTDIHIVSTLAQDWVTMPDGSDGVAEYFQSAYPNGTVDYRTQVNQSASWYRPTTPAAVKDSIHYNQIGYNEVGRESARNTLYILGILEKPDQETTVKLLDWTGFQLADSIKSASAGHSDTLVVPLVYPCYESKSVSYTLSGGLTWSYYDLLDTSEDGGTLTASVGDQTVTVAAREYPSYRFELADGELVSVSDEIFSENPLTVAGAGTYTLTEPIILMHNKEWVVEFNSLAGDRFMALTSARSTTEGMFYFFKSNSGTGVLAVGEYKDGLYQNYGLLQSQIKVDWKKNHIYRFENELNADGSNTIHIYVDDEWVGTATNLIINSVLQNTDNMYMSGKDLVFTNIGCSSFGLSNNQMAYLEVREHLHEHNFENGICTGCGAEDPKAAQPMEMRYDDHLDMTGKTVEILDAGVPTSYQVGCGVEENKVPDTAVVTMKDNTLVATGIGTAKVRIDGQLYKVTVEAAPISLMLLIGQSNMRGSEGNADQSIVCPDGMVYATFGDDRGDAEGIMNVNNAANFAASALTGEFSTVNVNGNTDNLSYYPINALTEDGAGTFGPDSGFAYEWVKQTGEKIWVVNAAHGGSAISSWQPNATNFKEAVLLFSACQETLRKEIAAGHFTLSHMGYFWCQGCNDASMTAETYVQKYLAMHEGLKSQLGFDHDSSSATADVNFEFAGIIPILYGMDSYRAGEYQDQNPYSYYQSFEQLTFNGPRAAQYWMCNNPELEDIWMVCNIGEDWVWMPDGTNGVSAYFQSHYENGTVDYTTQAAQKAGWYTPTTPAAVHDSIHYNQIGYNEIGRESVRNALIMLGEIPQPEVETTVELLSWDGYTPVTTISASLTGSSSTLVVPKVYPVWKTKEISYDLTDGFTWSYFDILTGDESLNGTLTMAGQTVAIEGHNWSDWETLYEPSADGPGKQERICSHCDLVEHRGIDGVWQIYDLAHHLVELPDEFCGSTNLWPILPHEDVHFTSGKKWGKISTPVPSITIPVNPGDRIFATSFQKAVVNGHETSNGIRVTFFDANGIAKTMGPGQTDKEFYANGGYLIAPEGTIAVNICMWYESDAYEVYILNREHCYENGVCTGCGAADPACAWQIMEDDQVMGAYTDLQSAVDACAPGGTIRLTGDISVTSGAIITKDLTIDGGSFLVDISACKNAFIQVEEGTALTLKDMQLDGGATGFAVDYDSVTYTNYTIPLKAGSNAADPKAAMSAIVSFGDLVCRNVDISNRYTASYGGAVQVRQGTAEFTSCDFTHNYGTTNGGALYIGSNLGDLTDYPIASVKIDGCTFSRNYTGYGGAIFATNTARIDITDSVFDSNTANGGKGGAIDLPGENITNPVAREKGLDYMQTTIAGCVFTNNWAGNDGFAIQSYDSELYVTDSDFIGNVGVHPTSSVGTISIEHYRGEDWSLYTRLENCLFEGNRGPCAVYGDHSSPSEVDMINCDFRGNQGNMSLLLYAATSRLVDCRFEDENMATAVIDARIYDNYQIPPELTLTDVTFTGCDAPAEILTRKQSHNTELNTYTVILKGSTNGDIRIWDNNAVQILGDHTGNVELDQNTDWGMLTIGDDASVKGICYKHPADVEAYLGERFAVSPEAEGEGLTYQWYYKDAGMEEFMVSDNRTSSYAYAMTKDMHGRQVYCMVTDAYGNQVTTDTAAISSMGYNPDHVFGAAVKNADGSIHKFDTLEEAFQSAAGGDTVLLLKDTEINYLLVPADVDFDLNGYMLTAAYVAGFGSIIDNSQENTGHLKVSKEKILIQKSNRQLPVWDQDGYRFVEVRKFNQLLYSENYKFVFQPLFEEAAHSYLLQGSELSGVSVGVRITWQNAQGTNSQLFTYNDAQLTQFIESYKGPGIGSYKSMFSLTLRGAENLKNLQFQITATSDTGVEILSDPVVHPGA